MRGLVLVVSGLLFSAGCLGGDGDAGADTDATGDDAVESSDVEGQAPAGDAAAGTTTWQVDNRTGTINGVNAVVLYLTGAVEAMTVPEGALTLAVNITITGGDVFATLSPPSCAPADPVQDVEQLLLGCPDDVDASTSGGASSVSIDGPEVGEWALTMFCSSTPGPCTVDYAALIALRLPA